MSSERPHFEAPSGWQDPWSSSAQSRTPAGEHLANDPCRDAAADPARPREGFGGGFGSEQRVDDQFAGDPYARARFEQQYAGPTGMQPVVVAQPVERAPRGVLSRWWSQAPVTMVLIGMCVLVWIGELLSDTVIDDVVLTPRLGASEPWRFLTSAFAHSTNPLHIVSNMYALFVLGVGLERLLGRGRYLALYLISAIGGGVVFVAMANPHSLAWDTGVVGASGAVFGLFGALVVIAVVNKRPAGQLWGVLLLNAFIGFALPGIAWQAHLGGFLVGALVTWFFLRDRSANHRSSWIAAAFVSVLVVALGVAKYAWVG